jgi:hypothetical protein
MVSRLPVDSPAISLKHGDDLADFQCEIAAQLAR